MTSSKKPPKKKRPYQSPRIVDSSAFERLALACNGTEARGGVGVKGAPTPNNCTTVTTS